MTGRSTTCEKSSRGKGTEVQKQYEAKTKAGGGSGGGAQADCGAIERQKNVHIEQLMASHERRSRK